MAPPISMRLKTGSLSELTDSLQKLTKVRFLVASDIADRKITAIFHDKSTSEVMSAVQDALFMEWKKAGDGYRLVLPTNVDHEEQAIVMAEDDAVRKGISDWLNRIASAPDLSAEEAGHRVKEIRAKITELRQNASPDSKEAIRVLREQLQTVNGFAARAICKSLAGDLPIVVDGLIAGHTFCASTRSVDAVPQLSTSYSERLSKLFPGFAAAVVMMRFDKVNQTIEGQTCIVGSGQRPEHNATDFFFYRPNLSLTPDLKASKLLTRLDKWAQDDPGVLKRPIVQPGRAEDPPAYYGHDNGTGLTLAEHLEYLADHADIPVIGDAFRIYCSQPQFRSESTVGAYLEGLKQSKHMEQSMALSPVGYSSSRNGWLFVRHQGFWHRQLQEIPERTLRPFEAIAQTKDFPSTNDYSAFISGLSSEQLAALDPLDTALRCDALPIHMATASLKLWSTLTNDQKNSAQNSGLGLIGASPAQVKIILDGWAEKMWSGQLPLGLWATFFSARGLRDVSPVLRYRTMNTLKMGPSRIPRLRDESPPSGPQEQVDFEYDLGRNVQIRDMYVVTKTHR